MNSAKEKHPSHVLIIDGDTLLLAGLRSLLDRQSDIRVSACSSGNQAELVRELERFRPNMILLAEAGSGAGQPELLAVLEEYATLASQGASWPDRVCIVPVSSDCNTAWAYELRQVEFTSVADLLALIPAAGSRAGSPEEVQDGLDELPDGPSPPGVDAIPPARERRRHRASGRP